MKVESEPDRVDPGFVLRVGIGSVAVAASCCAIAWLVLRWSGTEPALDAHHRARVRPPPAEVNQIEAGLLDGKEPATNADPARRLQSFGWSKEDGGLVHIPIDRAFQLYLEDQRSPGSPGGGSPAP